jgi:hypothetical protein
MFMGVEANTTGNNFWEIWNQQDEVNRTGHGYLNQANSINNMLAKQTMVMQYQDWANNCLVTATMQVVHLARQTISSMATSVDDLRSHTPTVRSGYMWVMWARNSKISADFTWFHYI